MVKLRGNWPILQKNTEMCLKNLVVTKLFFELGLSAVASKQKQKKKIKQSWSKKTLKGAFSFS